MTVTHFNAFCEAFIDLILSIAIDTKLVDNQHLMSSNAYSTPVTDLKLMRLY